LLREVVKRRADLGIQEQTFNTDFRGLMIYVNLVGKDGRLEGIFVYDKRDQENPHTVYARHGRLNYDQGQEAMLLHLAKGMVIRWSQDAGRRQTVEFETYQLPLRLFDFTIQESKSEKEMSLTELRLALKKEAPGTERFNRLTVELHQRFAMPLGALLLCLLAVPLGLSPDQHGRIWGLIMGLVVFLIYYVIFTASWRLAVNNRLNPALAPWMANFLFTGLAVYFWRRTIRELPLLPISVPWHRWSLRRKSR
jgi:lipopolysaccharide export system permease protein